MIKAIGFDLWETLITDTPELSKEQERLRITRMEEILRGRGHGDVAEDIERAYRALWHRCIDLYWSKDKDVPCRTQIAHFIEELGLAIDDEATIAELEHAYAHAAIDVLPAVVDGARELLAELKARGYRIGLISNTGRTPGYALRRILEELGLAQSIDAMVFSNEHGACKPQRSIFEELRDALGVQFEEMAFIGDNIYVDVHGSQRCGMRGIHFDPPVRGTAVAPPFEHGLEIVPDAHVTSLAEVVRLLEELHAR